jgi:hypothetical protein
MDTSNVSRGLAYAADKAWTAQHRLESGIKGTVTVLVIAKLPRCWRAI